MLKPYYPADDRLKALLQAAYSLHISTDEHRWPLLEVAKLADVNEQQARQMLSKAKMNTFMGNGPRRGKIIYDSLGDEIYYER